MSVRFVSSCETFQSAIYISAPEHVVEQVCAKFCMENPSCVTVEPVKFIYMGGAQSGYRIKFINYPRFPKSQAAIKQQAEYLAEILLRESFQSSCSVVHSDETVYYENGEKV